MACRMHGFMTYWSHKKSVRSLSSSLETASCNAFRLKQLCATHLVLDDFNDHQPKLVKRIKTAAGAHAFRAFGDKRHLLVSNRVANTISKIDMQTMTVVDNYPAPGGPDCLEVLDDGKTILVSSRWTRKLTMIDTQSRTVVRQVAVGKSPHGVYTLDHAPRQ